jgi:hypothetical protein
MTLDELKASIAGDEPPSLQPATIQALWHDARGDWDRAHQIAQEIDDPDGSWVHAYLHRKEGDLANASYWYRRAGRIRPSAPLSEEWAHIAETLLR